jgi:hydroxymethylbilane synthase
MQRSADSSAGRAPLLRLGSRGSPLALAQARLARDALADAAGVTPSERDARLPIVVLSTAGDRIQDRKLADAGGKGLFTKELEEALDDGRIDVAVHSMKDVPTTPPPSLALGAILPREDPRDAFISRVAPTLLELPQGARLGAASLRRQAQALALRPDLEIVLFRGNVGTRLIKLEQGVAHATFLAAAGLKRLDREDVITSLIDADVMLPAAAQGAIGLQIRVDDDRVCALCAAVDHEESALRITAERGLLLALDGSCRTPIAALAELVPDGLRLRAEALTPDGKRRWRRDVVRRVKTLADAAALGRAVGAEIRAEAGAALQVQG